MKQKLAIAAIILGGLAMTDCNKESANEMAGIPEGAFRLTSEGYSSNTKTSVSDNSVRWVNGDEVNINGTNYTVTVSGSEAYTSSDVASTSEYFAYYHCGTVTDPLTTTPKVQVPASYTSSYDVNGRQILELPMVAYHYGSTTLLAFKHVTAAFKVTVKNSTGHIVELEKVVVSSTSKDLCGTVALTLASDGAPTVGAVTDGGRSVTVNFAENTYVNNNSQVEVQVPILPITAGNITVEVFCHIAGTVAAANKYHYYKSGDSPALARNQMVTANVDVDPTVVASTTSHLHPFTVAYGKTVYFSKGNLQAVIASGSGDNYTASSWQFAENQWDHTGGAAGNNSFAPGSTVDLFGWVGSTASYNTYGLCTYSTSGYAGDDYYGTATNDHLNSDWGTLAISNGGNTASSGWFTLTKDEWVYLFNTRTDHDQKYGHGTVNSVKGMIILPDTWTLPTGLSFTAGNSEWTNSYTTEQWSQMEAAGAVFLPVTGFRNGKTVEDDAWQGHYWSSSPHSSQAYYALSVMFSPNFLRLPNNYWYRCYGSAVRLVCE